MINLLKKISCMASILLAMQAHAAQCPDPNQSSLIWGEIPPPWQINPVSPTEPQGEEGTRFIKANILVAGLTRGVSCTYRNSIGEYSIWWEVRVKRPERSDVNWHAELGGYECRTSLANCEFYP